MTNGESGCVMDQFRDALRAILPLRCPKCGEIDVPDAKPSIERLPGGTHALSGVCACTGRVETVHPPQPR